MIDSWFDTHHRSIGFFRNLVPSAFYQRYFDGFTAFPFTRISKWTCGPVLLPVLPTRAIASPCDLLPHLYKELRAMSIEGLNTFSVIDDDTVSVCSVPPCSCDSSSVRRNNQRSASSCKVDASMVIVFSSEYSPPKS